MPCICDECRQRTSPEMYEQEDLVRCKRLNRPTIECRQSFVNVSVMELLDGLKLDAGNRLALRTVRIFLASSAELKDDRDAFELYCRGQNDRLLREGLYLEITRWENFLDAMSETRLQDEYNGEALACDIFVSLFRTKTGKFTEEEFDAAYQAFQSNGKPLIYTYFKGFQISSDNINLDDLESLKAFKEKLSRLGHHPTAYEGAEQLKLLFGDQLHRLRVAGRL